MLLYVHTNRYEQQKWKKQQSFNGERDIYEIYWNIKYNHAMESINNNFRVNKNNKKKKRNDWMDGGERRKNQMSWCCVRDYRLRSKPHLREMKWNSSGMKWMEKILVLWEIVRGINIVCLLLKSALFRCSKQWGTGAFLTLRTCCFSYKRFARRYTETFQSFFQSFFFAFLLHQPAPCAMILLKSYFFRNLIAIIIRYVLAH